MRSTFLAVGVLGLVGAISACGDDRPDNADLDGNGARSGSGGKSNNAGKANADPGGAGGDGATDVDPLAPKVVITAPVGTANPNGDDVLTGDRVIATCRVTPSTEPGAGKVNASSVKIAIVGADDKVIEEKVGSPTETDDEYASELSLLTLPSGPVRFRCTAEDTEQHLGSAQLRTLLDHGPTIEFIKPTAMSAHALSMPLDIEFTVAPTLLTDDDEHAEVTKLALEVAGVGIDLTDAEGASGHYRLQINLNDPKFDPTPTGLVPVTVKASNGRAPKPVTATATRDTPIDGEGPVIAIVGPLESEVVGGNVQLKFTATDAVAGVDRSTIVVSLNDVDHPYDADSDAWSFANGTFTYEFDSRQVKNAQVQVTVNVGASDNVGNASAAVSQFLYLDNYPPVLDLDPLNIRSVTKAKRCSISFDPVGDGAENDLGHADIASLFRAIILDQTNSSPEFTVLHHSKTNPDSVRLFLEGDSTKPLLVDEDSDGACDEVAEVDSTNSIVLKPVPKSETPWYKKEAADAAPSAAAFGCTVEDTDSTPPKQLCTAEVSDMWQVVEDPYTSTPLIYAASVKDGFECTGAPWEFAGKLDRDGWVCFAARAVDNVGNVGISRPLRVCVDDPSVAGSPPCATSSTTPPSCTDGCTPPPRLGNAFFEIP